MIVLCGYLADCEGFEEVHDYAVDKYPLLKEFLELPCGIPSSFIVVCDCDGI